MIAVRYSEQGDRRDDFLRLSLLIQSMYAAVLVEDEARRIVLTNCSFCDLFGIPVDPAALVGIDCSTAAEQNKDRFLNPDAFVEGVAERLRDRTPVRGEVLRCRDGRILARDYIPIFQDHAYRGHLWVYTDITERETARQALADARDDAEAASQRNRVFAATLSHEVRTPMNAIAGIVDILLRTNLDPEQKRLVQALDANTRNIMSVLNHVLDLSAAEAVPLLEPEECDIEALLLEVSSAFEIMAEERSIRLYVLCAPDLPPVAVDSLRLRQALANLLANALKFTTEGEVAIKACVFNDELHLDVIDTGPGIAPEEQKTIFNAYEQGHTSKESQFTGTGLGLALARRFVEAIGATLSLQSTVGVGSTFSIRLRLTNVIHAEKAPERLAGVTVAVDGVSQLWRSHIEQVLRWAGAKIGRRGHVRIVEREPTQADAECPIPTVWVGVRNRRIEPRPRGTSVHVPRTSTADRLIRAVTKANGDADVEITSDFSQDHQERHRRLIIWGPRDSLRSLIAQRFQRIGYSVSAHSDLDATWRTWLASDAMAILVDRRVAPCARHYLRDRLHRQHDHGPRPRVVIDYELPTDVQNQPLDLPLECLVAEVGRALGRRIVLVADDDADSRMVVARYLHGSGRYAPLEAASVAAARSLLETEEIAAVVSDIYFDGESGLALARFLRSNEISSAVPLIALTGAKGLARSCRRAGFDAVVRKPACAQALLGLIDELLEPPPSSVVVEVASEISDLVPMFLQRRHRDLQTVTDDIADERFDRIFDVGHKVKGSGAAYGFTKLSELGGRLEHAGQQRDGLAAIRALLQIQRYLESVEVRVSEAFRIAE